ncbi:hypothetical protein [Mucilaginibacter sp. UR6-11]|uniref:hypothetical protein n=1 Tax=Mucilaginibacter sp. UR6-11 TaxID=1435644 RepID=UPI001E4C38F3|nr:hypothetical protein [Mucilaginibacter sp. UR6-11]MCC8427204.1 hypothetical protein [Mucilaginibacter sp. UR6-11]
MQRGKNKFHQKRPGIALALLVLFVLFTALCPVKRFFFSTANTHLLQKQNVKIVAEKQYAGLQQIGSVSSGLCGISYITFKQSITHKPAVNTDFIALALFTLLFTLLFRAFSFRVDPVPVVANYYMASTPIFLRNRIFLI